MDILNDTSIIVKEKAILVLDVLPVEYYCTLPTSIREKLCEYIRLIGWSDVLAEKASKVYSVFNFIISFSF